MVRCTIYAQISVLVQKANGILMSPQWGNNSKVLRDFRGEHFTKFQSPQWSSTFTLLTQRASIPIEVRLPIST